MSWTWAINNTNAWKEECDYCHGVWPREQVRRLEDGRHICIECDAWLNMPVEELFEETDEDTDI